MAELTRHWAQCCAALGVEPSAGTFGALIARLESAARANLARSLTALSQV